MLARGDLPHFFLSAFDLAVLLDDPHKGPPGADPRRLAMISDGCLSCLRDGLSTEWVGYPRGKSPIVNKKWPSISAPAGALS